MSKILKRPMFRRGGSTNDGIMTGLTDRKQLSTGGFDKEILREQSKAVQDIFNELAPIRKTRLPLGEVGLALAGGADPLTALEAGYRDFVKRDDVRQALLDKRKQAAVSTVLGAQLSRKNQGTLANRKKAIINIRANPDKFKDGLTEENIIKETARLNKLDEVGKAPNLQRIIFDREKELRTSEGLPAEQAKRLANFEYILGPKIQQNLDANNIEKTVQGLIKFREGQYVTRNKAPGIYFDPKTSNVVEITNELEVIVNPPDILAFL
jgi:hypothetical protein